MRSKLFVPGSRPELFDKALAGDADGLSFDLEDAVAEPRKAEARAAVGALLARAGASNKTLVVRVNAIGTPHFEADLEAVMRPGVAMINLPKPESAEHVRAAAAAMSRVERGLGLPRPIGLLVNVETPRALRLAAELAAADARVAGLQLGLGDLFEPLQIDRREPAAVHAVMLQVRLAAGEAGVPAWDSAYADFGEVDGLRAEAALARRLGFAGKSCIHPRQVMIVNDVFRPTDGEIAHAARVLAAAEEAASRGIGAWTVDGRMVDAPFVARARAVAAQAQRLGLWP